MREERRTWWIENRWAVIRVQIGVHESGSIGLYARRINEDKSITTVPIPGWETLEHHITPLRGKYTMRVYRNLFDFVNAAIQNSVDYLWVDCLGAFSVHALAFEHEGLRHYYYLNELTFV